MNAQPVRFPDLSARPLRLTAERIMDASPEELYRAWTGRLDLWFADPGSMLGRAAVNQPFYFTAGGGHPHYGRFLRLIPEQLVEATWVTGEDGTEGAETVVTVEFIPHGAGTRLLLTHVGFPNSEALQRHEQAWPVVLENLDSRTAAAV